MKQSSSLLARLATRLSRAGPANAFTEKAPDRKSLQAHGNLIALHAMAQAGWTHHAYSALAQQGFMRNPVVYRCVRMISEAAAAIPWLGYQDGQEVPGHDALRSLARPNLTCSQSVFFETFYGHLLLNGTAYLERSEGFEGRFAMYLLPPAHTRTLTAEDGWPSALEVTNGNAKRVLPLTDGIAPGIAMQLSLFHPSMTTPALRHFRQRSQRLMFTMPQPNGIRLCSTMQRDQAGPWSMHRAIIPTFRRNNSTN